MPQCSVSMAGPSSSVALEQLVAMLVDRARSEGLQLTGEGGLLRQLTKRVLESAPEGEIADGVSRKTRVVGVLQVTQVGLEAAVLRRRRRGRVCG